MRHLHSSAIFMVVLNLGVAASAGAPSKAERLVTVGPVVTETVFALGAGGQVVGRDLSSDFPTSVSQLPNLGYQRTLSAESILALRPTRILASEEAGPPATLEQLRSAGIPVHVFRTPVTREGVHTFVKELSHVLGRSAEGDAFHKEWEKQLVSSSSSGQRRVLAFYARGGNVTLAAGGETAANALIGLAGGVNTVTGYTGYKPLNPELLLVSPPDVVLVPRGTLKSLGGEEALFRLPGLGRPGSAKRPRVVAVDDVHFFGFGPRLPEAVTALKSALEVAGRP